MKKPRTKTRAAFAHQCVVCFIDSDSDLSGVSIWVGGKLHMHGAVKTATSRDMWVGRARGVAEGAGLPLVFAVEDTNGRFKTWMTAIGYGDARGMWLQAIEASGYRLDHIVWIPVNTWRSRLGIGKHADRKAYKAAAMRRVKQEFGLTVGDDEAEAILGGKVATLAPETAEMLGKISRARKKAAA